MAVQRYFRKISILRLNSLNYCFSGLCSQMVINDPKTSKYKIKISISNGKFWCLFNAELEYVNQKLYFEYKLGIENISLVRMINIFSHKLILL